MKKEIIKNDRKWICEEKANYYEVKYYEYSKICNVWTYVSKDNWSTELVEELERDEQMKENEVSDYEKEKAMNDLQRGVFITKVLAELTVDLTVCKLMSDEPLKEWKIYLEKFKKEIDNLYERVSNK